MYVRHNPLEFVAVECGHHGSFVAIHATCKSEQEARIAPVSLTLLIMCCDYSTISAAAYLRYRDLLLRNIHHSCIPPSLVPIPRRKIILQRPDKSQRLRTILEIKWKLGEWCKG
jgi:hypothetical protein